MEHPGSTAGGAGVADDAGAGTAAAPLPRTLPAADPGPVIVRPGPAGEGVGTAAPPRRGPGRPAGSRTRAKARKRAPAKARGGAPASATAPPPPPAAEAAGDGRTGSADRLYRNHARVARLFGNDDLALSRGEADELAGAFAQLGELTGWRPASPIFLWLESLAVIGGIYGYRIWLIAERRRAAAAAHAAIAAPGAAGAPSGQPAAPPMPPPIVALTDDEPAIAAGRPVPGVTTFAERMGPP